MSKYTTELRFICESVTGNTSSQSYAKTDAVMNEIVEDIKALLFQRNRF